MTLTTHAIIGTLSASLFPTHPIIGFATGFASHFIIDAIPHFDYALKSYEERDKNNPLNNDIVLDKRFAKDLINIGLDILVGMLASVYILLFIGKFSLPILIAGAFGGILPDALQVVYIKFRHEPFVSLQKFHMWIQRDRRLKNKPFIGLISQIVLIAIVVFLASMV